MPVAAIMTVMKPSNGPLKEMRIPVGSDGKCYVYPPYFNRNQQRRPSVWTSLPCGPFSSLASIIQNVRLVRTVLPLRIRSESVWPLFGLLTLSPRAYFRSVPTATRSPRSSYSSYSQARTHSFNPRSIRQQQI